VSMKSKVLLLVGGLVLICVLLLLSQTRVSIQGDDLEAGFDAEFLTRPDGYSGLCEKYDFRFANEPRQMDPGLMYKACSEGAVDVINGFATDGRIPAYNLKVLEDDLDFFPPYYAAPLVRKDTLEEHPEIETALNGLAGRITDKKMQKLNYKVDEENQKARDVAMDFLVEEDLLDEKSSQGDGSAGKVVLGGKQFTEQEILGEMMAILLERNTDLDVERRLNLGGTMICFNALKSGDLDLYAEYTGTGLVNILKRDVVKDPDETLDIVRQAFDEQYDLAWLEPFGFNNTYTLTMKREKAESLGIETISDLAARLSEE